MKCEKCGTEFEGTFCTNCGTKYSEPTVQTTEKPVDYYEALKKIEAEKEEKEKKKKKKKRIGCLIPVIILVALIVIGCLKIGGFFKPASKEENKTSTTEVNNQSLVEITDTTTCFCRDNKDLLLSDYSFYVKNNNNKNIEHITFTISLFNDQNVEKGKIEEECDIIIAPNEKKEAISKEYFYFNIFSDVFIDGEFIANMDTLKITNINVKYADETEESINCDIKIDKNYYRGVLSDKQYYFEYNDYYHFNNYTFGTISAQKIITIDTSTPEGKEAINKAMKEADVVPKLHK